MGKGEGISLFALQGVTQGRYVNRMDVDCVQGAPRPTLVPPYGALGNSSLLAAREGQCGVAGNRNTFTVGSGRVTKNYPFRSVIQ